MGGPSRGGHQVAILASTVEPWGGLIPNGTCLQQFGLYGGIRLATPPRNHAGRRKNLQTVADCRNRLLGSCKVTHQGKHSLVESQVLGCPTTWNDERIVLFGFHLCKRGVEPKPMPRFFAVGLMAIEIVDGRGHKIARLLARADGIYPVAQHRQRLEGNHHFVVFHEVACENEY